MNLKSSFGQQMYHTQVQHQQKQYFQKQQKIVCPVKAQIQQGSFLDGLKKNVVTLTAASLIVFNQVPQAIASEMDIYSDPKPGQNFILDDAGVLSKVTKGGLTGKLKEIQEKTGYTIDVVTTRKLEYEPDAFQFGDKLRKKWFGEDPKAAILLFVSAGKDGALVGGEGFVSKLGEEFLDSITGQNIPYYSDKQKFNEGAEQTINRIYAVLDNQQDPGAPNSDQKQKKRTYKTKEETDKTKLITSTIVIVLLLIAFVVPMLQYFGFVNE